MESAKKPNKKLIIIVSILVGIGIFYGGYKIVYSFSHEDTDDAQIQANMNPIIPHVGGYIKKVYVKDNQVVKKGDTLFVIDNRDYQIKFEQANAGLMAAQSQLEMAKTSISSYRSNAVALKAQVNSASESIGFAKIKLRRATNDFKRYKNLYANHVITTQKYEQSLALKQEAEKQLGIEKNQQKVRQSQHNAAGSATNISEKKVAVEKANVKSAQAKLDAVLLDLDYTVMKAPINGQLSNVPLQAGQFVQPGQALFYLVNTKNKWVVANFKETQLGKMKIGQKVSIKVDAFPKDNFNGIITAFSPATGARFSLLPPDNATGNFVKTIQRLPVKIDFTKNNDVKKLARLSSGMNVTVDVHIK